MSNKLKIDRFHIVLDDMIKDAKSCMLELPPDSQSFAAGRVSALNDIKRNLDMIFFRITESEEQVEVN